MIIKLIRNFNCINKSLILFNFNLNFLRKNQAVLFSNCSDLKILLSFSEIIVYVLTIPERNFIIETSCLYWIMSFLNPASEILGQIPRTF